MRTALKMLLMGKRKPFDYYVDSVNGSDSNDGKTAGSAFATIGKLGTIAAGTRIGLAKGSTWREQLFTTEANVHISSYGTGNRPVLDASDLISSESWAKSDGYTNIYHVAVSLASQLGAQHCNVFENSAFLSRVASAAACDSTPGSYYATANYGNSTVYIHPTGSTSPLDNGNVYEITVRNYGLRVGAACTVRGIEARQPLSDSGCLVFGRSCRVYDCRAINGGSHCVFTEDGGYLEGVYGYGGYNGASGCTIFVYNEATPAGLGVTFSGCIAEMPAPSTLVSGFYGHKNTSGAFGIINYIGCSAINCANGYQGEDATLVLTDCVTTATDCPIRPTAVGQSVVITGGTFAGLSSVVNFGAADIVMTITGATLNLAAGATYPIRNGQAGISLALDTCTISGSAAAWAIYSYSANPMTITCTGTRFAIGNYFYVVGALTFTGDNNAYAGGITGSRWNVSATPYNFAGWQALVAPQDAHSTNTAA